MKTIAADTTFPASIARLGLCLAAAGALAAAAFGELRYCEKGTEHEHSHYSSHDVPSAMGVRVKQKGPTGYSCTTGDHPVVNWSRPFDGGQVDFSIDIRPIGKEKADLYIGWIRDGRIKGGSAQMDVGEGWTEKARCVMRIGNVKAVAADLASEGECAWRHMSAVPAEGGMVVVVDFRVRAESAAAAEKYAGKSCSEIAYAMSEFELLNPLSQDGLKSTATGWFVSPSHVVSAAHCTEDNSSFWFEDGDGRRVELKVVGCDSESDVALLEVSDPKWRSQVFLPVAQGVPRRAEKVWTLGYPLPQSLGRTAKYGEGVVSSHEGLHGDSTRFSVTAPIRPGSSGGPVFNASGEVCGVMVATLQARESLKNNGHISPESNFAVKIGALRSLLEKHGVPLEGSARSLPEERADAVEEASRGVILLHADSK